MNKNKILGLILITACAALSLSADDGDLYVIYKNLEGKEVTQECGKLACDDPHKDRIAQEICLTMLAAKHHVADDDKTKTDAVVCQCKSTEGDCNKNYGTLYLASAPIYQPPVTVTAEQTGWTVK